MGQDMMHLMTFDKTRGNIMDNRKLQLKGVLKALCRDTSRANLCVTHVQNGCVFCTDGHRLNWTEMEGLPEDGEYDVYILSKSRALFIRNFNCGSYPKVEQVMKPMAHTKSILGLAGISAIGKFAKTLVQQAYVLEVFKDLPKEGRVTLSYGNPNDKEDEYYPVILDNGLWKTLVMPVRDWDFKEKNG